MSTFLKHPNMPKKKHLSKNHLAYLQNRIGSMSAMRGFLGGILQYMMRMIKFLKIEILISEFFHFYL